MITTIAHLLERLWVSVSCVFAAAKVLLRLECDGERIFLPVPQMTPGSATLRGFVAAACLRVFLFRNCCSLCCTCHRLSSTNDSVQSLVLMSTPRKVMRCVGPTTFGQLMSKPKSRRSLIKTINIFWNCSFVSAANKKNRQFTLPCPSSLA